MKHILWKSVLDLYSIRSNLLKWSDSRHLGNLSLSKDHPSLQSVKYEVMFYHSSKIWLVPWAEEANDMAEKSFISLLMKRNNLVPNISSRWHSLTFDYFFRTTFYSERRLQNPELWNDSDVIIIKINIPDQPMNWNNMIFNTNFNTV